MFLSLFKLKKSFIKISNGIKLFLIIFCLFIAILIFFFPEDSLAVFNCSVTTSCSGSNLRIMRMQATDNSHAELATQLNYLNFVCCTGLGGINNTCSGNYAVIGTLSANTNAHFEDNTQANYDSANDICLSSAVGTPSVAYQENNCDGYDTTLFSTSATGTNLHVATSSAYTHKVCASIPLSLSFSISDNDIGFGTLSSAISRYATGDGIGTTTETAAHSITTATNAEYGYSLTVLGGTLASGTSTISAIGSSTSTPNPGTAQFGLRITSSGGVGTVSAPYNDNTGYAYAATATTTDEIASASLGDGEATTYSIRYLANISPIIEAGSYSTTLTYIISANF